MIEITEPSVPEPFQEPAQPIIGAPNQDTCTSEPPP